jgi:hypothetical protein
MNEEERRRELAATWIERASLRLAECEAELRRREAPAPKLAARADRYRSLVADLRALALGATAAPEDSTSVLDDIDRELQVLKERLLLSARDLAKAREEYRDLKQRWGALADRIMRAREKRGEEAGRVPALDFRLPPPPPDAPAEEKAGMEILRSLGL